MRSESEATSALNWWVTSEESVWRRDTYLKLDDPFLGKAQVHAFRVLQVEGTLVELGDGVVGVQQRRLLVHLTDNLTETKTRERERKGLSKQSSILNISILIFCVFCFFFQYTELMLEIPVSWQHYKGDSPSGGQTGKWKKKGEEIKDEERKKWLDENGKSGVMERRKAGGKGGGNAVKPGE